MRKILKQSILASESGVLEHPLKCWVLVGDLVPYRKIKEFL